MTAKLNLVYFGDFTGPLFEKFNEIAKTNYQFEYFHVSSECAVQNGATHNSLAVFRTFDQSPVHYTHNSSIEEWM